MEIIKTITDDEMIATFLQAEINSERYESMILTFLGNPLDRKALESPDISNKIENDFRRKLLGAFRGYGQNKLLFHSFPENVLWKKVMINKKEFEAILYANWEYWVEETYGTRQPKELARRVRSGDLPDSEDRQRFLRTAERIKSGAQVPTIILVAKNRESKLVALEGHLRLTAYALEPTFIPSETEVIVGFSEDMDKWGNF
jgi:hypothetical protein